MPADAPLLPAVLVPELDAARAFLAALDPRSGATFGFRTFDDRRDDPRLAVCAYGTLDRGIRQSRNPVKDGRACCPARLVAFMQRLGAGAFVVVNQLDGVGQAARNVVAARACFVDADTAQQVGRLEEFIAASYLKPTIVIASGGRDGQVDKLQAFWRVENLPVSRFRRVQEVLVSRIGSDPAVIDPARVMRLPGFCHQKREPRQTRIVNIDGGTTYNALDFVQCVVAMPAITPIRRSRPATQRRQSAFDGSATGDRTVRLRQLIATSGGLFSSAVRQLVAEATAPTDSTPGNRHSTVMAVAARLVHQRWPAADITALLAPTINETWGDGDWTEHVASAIQWAQVRQGSSQTAPPF